MSNQKLSTKLKKNDILETILDGVEVRISFWDLSLTCLYTNKKGLEWFGIKEDLVGRSAKDVFEPPVYEKNLPYFQTAAKGVAQTFTREIKTPTGEVKFLLTNYTPLRIAGQIQGVVVSITDVTELKNIEQELKIAKEKAEALATHDFLTGLPNRVLLYDRIGQSIALAERTNSITCLITLDLDGFKQINDTYGHLKGDIVLKLVAKRLLSATRESDTVARFGGDEFLILPTQVKSVEDITILVNRILRVLNKKMRLAGKEMKISVSMGIAIFPLNSKSLKELVNNSDKAMYLAKKKGKNCFVIWKDR